MEMPCQNWRKREYAGSASKEMLMYKKRNSGDTWHWMRNCSKMPQGRDVVTRQTRPASGELCNECLAKEKARKGK
jgi:hypothetical protein